MIEIPTWLAMLPKNAGVKSKEFADLLGVSYETLMQRHRNGLMGFPPPDYSLKGRITGMGTPAKGAKTWKAVTVRNYIRHLNRKELEKSK